MSEDRTPVGAPMLRFDEQVVIVTGAGRGIGREHALLLGSRGATVIVNDVSERHAQDTVDEITAAGGRAQCHVASVADPAAAKALVEDTHSGLGRLDAVLNNAGSGGPSGPIETVDDAFLARVVDSHLLGSFYIARAAWPLMVAAGGGRLVFTSSGSALGLEAASAYAMAKAGVWGLTRSLAVEGRQHGIAVNALLPIGYTRPAAAMPDEAVRQWMEDHFPTALCSPAAALLCHPGVPCTGELISVGGGRVGRIATVGAPGLFAGADLTIETVRDRWDEVVDMAGSKILPFSSEELTLFPWPTPH